MSTITPLSLNSHEMPLPTGSKRRALREWIIIGMAVLGFTPLVILHLWGLWRREQYQYFPFVIAACAYLLYVRRCGAETDQERRGSAISPRLAIIGSWVLLFTAALIQSPWLAAVSLNVFIAGVLIALSRTQRIQNLWGIWILLWLLVPLPLGVDTRIVVKLQGISSRVSSQLLDMLGVRHLMAGNVLQLPDKQFFVDEACSGIVSVMSIIACALIWVVWKNRALIHVILLTLAGVGWAISLNIARICLVALAHAWWGRDWSTGWQHDTLGFILFSMTFLAVISTDQLLVFLLRPIDNDLGEYARANRNPFERAWNWITQWCDPTDGSDGAAAPDLAGARQDSASDPPVRLGLLGGVAFLVPGLISLVPMAVATQNGFHAVAHAEKVSGEFLPSQIGPLLREGFENIQRPSQHELGDYSKAYTYRDPSTNRRYSISFDFPFSGGWHELCVCYENTGWSLVDRQVERSNEMDEWPVVSGAFTRGPEEHGYVAFSNFNADAEGIGPATEMIFYRPWRRLRRRLLKTVSSQVFQVQVWTEGTQEIDQATRQLVDATLLDARERFRAHFEQR